MAGSRREACHGSGKIPEPLHQDEHLTARGKYAISDQAVNNQKDTIRNTTIPIMPDRQTRELIPPLPIPRTMRLVFPSERLILSKRREIRHFCIEHMGRARLYWQLAPTFEGDTMASGPKITKHIEADDLPAFLRELADAMEGGGSGEFDCMDDIERFKIGGKREFGKITIKAKFKTSSECRDEELAELAEAEPRTGTIESAKPPYSALKKRMRSSFKLLLKTIHDNEMPPDEAVSSFLDDSALMVTYPGYGDEFYAQYTEVCDRFRTAYEARDIDAMHEAVDALIHEKSRCHAKYD